MRESISSLAIICSAAADENRWLVQWNRNWNALSLIGGHLEEGETFRDCIVRELREELGVIDGTDVRVGRKPFRHLEYEAWSKSARRNTKYKIALFYVDVSGERALQAIGDQSINEWVSYSEIKQGESADGRPISETVRRIIDAIQEHDASEADLPQSHAVSANAYKPQPIDTSQIELSPEIIDLTEKLAQNAHDHWARQRLIDGWSFGPARDDIKKEHPFLVPYDDLPDSEKVYDRSVAMESIKSLLALGYEIKKKARPEPSQGA